MFPGGSRHNHCVSAIHDLIRFVWIVLSISVLKVFPVFSLGVETSLLSTWRILVLRLINALPESTGTRINLLKHRVIKVFSKENLFRYKGIL